MSNMGFACLAIECEEMEPWILAIAVYATKEVRLLLTVDYYLTHLWMEPLTGIRSYTP